MNPSTITGELTQLPTIRFEVKVKPEPEEVEKMEKK